MSSPLPRRDPVLQPLWYKDAVICQLQVNGPYAFLWFKLRRF